MVKNNQSSTTTLSHGLQTRSKAKQTTTRDIRQQKRCAANIESAMRRKKIHCKKKTINKEFLKKTTVVQDEPSGDCDLQNTDTTAQHNRQPCDTLSPCKSALVRKVNPVSISQNIENIPEDYPSCSWILSSHFDYLDEEWEYVKVFLAWLVATTS